MKDPELMRRFFAFALLQRALLRFGLLPMNLLRKAGLILDRGDLLTP